MVLYKSEKSGLDFHAFLGHPSLVKCDSKEHKANTPHINASYFKLINDEVKSSAQNCSYVV